MATIQALEGLIVKNPQLRNGRPIISSAGVTVRTIVSYYKLGLTPEEISDQIDIDLAAIYAALAYYQMNRDEIESDIQANAETAVMQEFGTHNAR